MAYAAPTNAKTPRQLRHRALFTQAVKAWQGLSPVQRAFYDAIATRMSGFNVIVGRSIAAARRKQEVELPFPLRWNAEGPTAGAFLIVRASGRELFTLPLDEGAVEIALTGSDAPYELVVDQDGQEAVVLALQEGADAEVPEVLEAFGIRLVLQHEEASTPAEETGAEA